jgi:hypothetical protein
MWVVTPKANLASQAGGREIHILPSFQRPRYTHMYLRGRPDPIDGAINPRRFIPVSDLETLQEAFPTAVGVRVFFSGFVVVLFDKQKDLEKSWKEGLMSEFGCLHLGQASQRARGCHGWPHNPRR